MKKAYNIRVYRTNKKTVYIITWSDTKEDESDYRCPLKIEEEDIPFDAFFYAIKTRLSGFGFEPVGDIVIR